MNDYPQNLSPTEQFDYLLKEARRQFQLGAYRMALTWAFHARQMAKDDPAQREQADALFSAARLAV
jgi:hypothetical protein